MPHLVRIANGPAMSRKPTYVDGILAAATLVAEITGKQKLGDMSQREYELVIEINRRLIELAHVEANKAISGGD